MKDYNKTELHVFNNLNYYDDLTMEMIERIGDIEPVRKRLQEVIAQKDLTLTQKGKNFIPLAQKNLINCINGIKISAQHRYNQLANNDKVEIERQQIAIGTRINQIQSRLEEYFSEIYSKMERFKLEILKELRQSSREYEKLSTKTGVDVNVKSFRVSDSKWYNPFTWGNSHKEYYTYETHYTYIDANDAIENIRNYARESASSIESSFIESTDLSNLKRQMLKLVVENFDASDENFDPTYFKLLTERTLNKIEIPVIKINVDEYINLISNKFSGEIRDSSARSQIQTLMSEIIGKLFDIISTQFNEEILTFHKKLDLIKDSFADHLLADINKDFENLKNTYSDKEFQIKELENYISMLKEITI